MPASSPPKKRSPISKKIDEFLEYMEIEKGSSPLTIRNYKHYLKRFDDWMHDGNSRQELKDINSGVIRQYRIYLSRRSDGRGGTISRKTQGYHVIALRSLLRWLLKNDYEVMSPDKIDLPKVQDRQIKFLNGAQVDRLLNAPSLSTIQGKRDKAILELFYSTGLRVSELSGLDKDRLDLKSREFGVVGKGGKARVVFLSSRAAEWVEKYLKAREDKYKPLFIRHKGKMGPTESDESMRLTPRSVQRMLKKYVKKINLPVDATPHIIRHSFATDLLMAGADLRSVQEMLGHKNVSTTQIYTHVTNKQLKDVHMAFHGKGGKD